jgi:hypothetical protein
MFAAIEDRLRHELGGSLNHPIGSSGCRAAFPRRWASRSSPAAPDRAGTSSRAVPHAGPPAMPPGLLLDLGEAHPVHTRRARIVASQPVGVTQDVLPCRSCR